MTKCFNCVHNNPLPTIQTWNCYSMCLKYLLPSLHWRCERNESAFFNISDTQISQLVWILKTQQNHRSMWTKLSIFTEREIQHQPEIQFLSETLTFNIDERNSHENSENYFITKIYQQHHAKKTNIGTWNRKNFHQPFTQLTSAVPIKKIIRQTFTWNQLSKPIRYQYSGQWVRQNFIHQRNKLWTSFQLNSDFKVINR